ncbi:50S ribosomal protein L21 [Candidatus Liberibacter africanus]|uniref:Large ribosomal subunit protein bL21 n=1 Tax=Candidatus Liberibacter africanus PTSAPSY TaxID=1277257 RepID=A0A0G3I6V5_LIBAF|nr:50S ribosomal protein L21 [Candidatus Liberibacter africanus]AKK20268.1 50S ribosomal protein L21 [Candidatus Liberibacter africanus PTSAPSY]QTP64031.1 50S ribosomal protein L21 [Candidatus Liberibacter africanus]
MFAVIKHGGKQSIVSSTDTITVEKIVAKDGDNIRFDNVLAIGEDNNISIGSPCVEGAYVEAEVIKQIRTKKVIVFKKRRRQNYRRTRGHRQEMTVVRITGIVT